MDREDFRRVADLFERASRLPPERRAGFLSEVSSGDPVVRAKVESLLRHDTGEELEDFCEKHPRVVGGLADVLDSWHRSAGPAKEPPSVIGEFELREELGRGGMGVVYLARQTSLGRDVALKLLPSEATTGDESLERFHREATLLGRISHSSIVPVYLVGSERGFHFIAMEFVDGADLAELLVRHRDGRDEELPEAFRDDFRTASVSVARDMADALATAHAHGVIHRDVKPSNILIDATGRGRLADFGLARDLAAATLTASGAMPGTTYYMSPERFRSERPAPGADVYGLGVVLYECVVGRRPFHGDSIERLMASIIEDDAQPPRRVDPEIPKDLETIILKCLEKDPDHRYPDGAALRDDLDRFLTGRSIRTAPVHEVTRAYRRAKRQRTSLVVTVIILLAAVGFLFWGSIERGRRMTIDAQKFTTELSRALTIDDLDAAKSLMDAWLEKSPDDVAVRFERADLALRRKEWADAERHFRVLVDGGGTDGEAAATGLEHVLNGLDGTYAPKLDPARAPSSARESYYRGLILQSLNRFAEARVEVERAVRDDPVLTVAWFTLGALRYEVRDLAAAEDAFSTYRMERPGHAELFLMLGQIELQRQDFEAARTHFEQLVGMVEDHAVGQTNLGAAYIGLARRYGELRIEAEYVKYLEKAETALETAASLEPDFYMVAFNEAELRALEGRYDEADRSFVRALELGARLKHWKDEPYQEAFLHLRFAHVLNLGKEIPLSEKALVYATRAQELWPAFEREELWAFVHARALYILRRLPEALEAVDRALAGPLSESVPLTQLRAKILSKM